MSLVAAPLASPAYFRSVTLGLESARDNLDASVERLSSGNRIINVGDDVAAYSVAAGLQSQLSGLRAASTNVAQGSSLLQVATGGLTQINDLLSNLNNIAQQGNSSALSNNDRAFLQQQFSDLFNQIDTVAGSTSFNNINLLDGTLSAGTNILVGPKQGDNINIAIGDFGTVSLFSASTPDIRDPAHAATAQTAIATATTTVGNAIGNLTGLQSSFSAAAANLTQSIIGVTSANSNLSDTDIPTESTTFIQDTLKVNAGIAVVAQALALPSRLITILHTAGNS